MWFAITQGTIIIASLQILHISSLHSSFATCSPLRHHCPLPPHCPWPWRTASNQAPELQANYTPQRHITSVSRSAEHPASPSPKVFLFRRLGHPPSLPPNPELLRELSLFYLNHLDCEKSGIDLTRGAGAVGMFLERF